MKGYQALPEKRCGNCKYFCLHYRRAGKGRYVPLLCGHCTHPRIKDRRVEEHCPHWTAKDGKTADEPGSD